MANRIKGITVEIGGDTTKLTDALKSVNGQIKNTQTQLKDVEKLLKLDPGNTELLVQKHRLLGDAVNETKEKLETLKTAAEQANQALSNGDITQDQYDALQREIVETEQALERLEEQANESATAVQKIAVAGENMKDFGSKVESTGKSLLPLSAAVTGIGVAGLKVATDFETAMSSVKAITGATGEEFELLREKAIDLGATTAFSSGEVAEAMTEMGKAGWSTQQILDGMSGVLDATAASGESLGSVATIVADSITGFGLAASDSARVADLLTQAANSGTIGITDLGESYKYIAPIAQSMGMSIEDVTTAISAMSMAGIKGSQAGTAIRTVLTNMAKPTDTVATAMDNLGISITNSDGTFKSLDEIVTIMRTSFSGLTDDQKAYYATALAGKEGMSGLLSLLNLTQAEYDALSASMNNCSGVAGETAAVMQDNLQSKVEQMGGALETLAIKLADYVIPFLTKLVEKVTSAIDAFTNFSPGVQKAVLVIGSIVAAAGPVLIVVGKIISAVGTIMSIVPKLAGVMNVVKGAFAGINAIMAANPILLIITAIAALVAAFIYLWNNCEGFRQFWIDLWENIKQVTVVVWETIKNFLVAVWESIKSVFQTVFEVIKGIFETVLNVIKTIVMTYFNVYKTIIQTVMTVIQTVISTVCNTIKTVITTVLNAIKTVFTTIWNSIKTIVQAVVSGITALITGDFEGVKNAITTIMSTIQNTISTVWNTISGAVSTVLDTIKNAISSVFTNIKTAISDTMSSIFDTIKDGFEGVVGYITSLASKAFTWGKDLVMGIVNGIKSCISAVGDAVKSVADKITSFLHFSVPDEGPLTEYESWMPDFMQGLAKGIEDSRGLIEKAVSGVASDMIINPKLGRMDTSGLSYSGHAVSTESANASITSAITDALGKLSGNTGDIVIPVYLGGNLLDEVIVNAQQRANLRSGGR
ncbi:phage tail tape measure protein [uncultured Allofournierella sp.]|uniref:phage tail tape measure protein n=1 Tax=uncultured Allofournierella sp. TaxID=1940258 RepID=UPI00375340A6